MDKRIEMSYCGFEAFKSLAQTHLGVESHELFDTVRELLEEVDMTPADVIEQLTPKSRDDDAGSCLAASWWSRRPRRRIRETGDP